MRKETLSLQERRERAEVARRVGQGAGIHELPPIPETPLEATRETVRALISELQQRRFERLTDAQLLSNLRRLLPALADLERKQRKPWWKRITGYWKDRLARK